MQDYEALANHTLSVTVRAIDQGGLFVDHTFTVAINDASDGSAHIDLTPLAQGSSVYNVDGYVAVTENVSGIYIAQLSVNGGPEIDRASVTYSVNDSHFTIVNGNQLYLTTPFDHEDMLATYGSAHDDISITATDSHGLLATQIFPIFVNDVNEDTITFDTGVWVYNPGDVYTIPESLIINENSNINGTGNGVEVLAVAYSDLTLVNNAGGTFALSGNDLRPTHPLNHEAQSYYDIILSGKDALGTTHTEAYTIFVGDVNEAPTGVILALPPDGHVHASDVQQGGTISTLHGIDPDVGDVLTYSIDPSYAHAGDFTIQGNEIHLANGHTLTPDTTYDIPITVEDSHQLTYEGIVHLPIVA
jgi:hypothetical protein